ncbi:MAG: hypothetical protein KatS3mg102_1132 [Planctomycetota bacterium]|nr:MAG: hypothetical protein KatS3mg102_1132 [Planctomycetota bacterium]
MTYSRIETEALASERAEGRVDAVLPNRCPCRRGAAPSRWGPGVALALALLAQGGALAQEGMAALGRDDRVEVLLGRARELAAVGRLAEAVKALLLVEDRLEELGREDPAARPVVLLEQGLACEARLAVRRQLVALGPEALASYRAARDPVVQQLLRQAAAEPGRLAPLLRAAEGYPLASRGPEALLQLGDLYLERGEYAAAERAYARLAEPAADLGPVPEPVREAARARREAVRRRLLAAAPAEHWPMMGGGPSRARAARTAPVPGAVRFEVELPASEVSEEVVRGYARRRRPPPLVYHPAVDGESAYLADALTVAALGLQDGRVRWLYVASDPRDPRPRPPSVPERLDNMAYAPALVRGRLYVTLNRNTPPVGWQEQDRAVLARDWRLVALHARSGRLLWDASEQPELQEISQRALCISQPLVVDGRVLYAVAMPQAGGVHALLLALEAGSGRVLYRSYLGSASPDNYLARAVMPAPPALAGGLVIVQPQLGLVAACALHDGSPVWVARYAPHPPGTLGRIIEHGHRFRPSPPRVLQGVVVLAPQDAPYLFGFDAASGRLRWRLPRAGLETVVGVARGRLVVAGGGRALAVDPAEGRIAWQTPLPGPPLRGTGCAAEDRIIIPAADRFHLLDAQSGAPLGPPVHFDPGRDWAGNLVATPQALLVATRSGLLVFEPLERSERLRAEGAAGGDAASMLALARLHARLGESARALDLIERVVGAGGGPDSPLGREARSLGVALGERVLGEPPPAGAGGPPAEQPRQRALGLARRALALARPEPAAVRLGRRLAEELEAAGRLAEAVETYVRLLRLGAEMQAEVELAPGLAVPLEPWVRARLQALRARPQAASALAAYDAEARQALEAARRAGTREAFRELVQRYPTTPAEAEALIVLADLYEARGVLRSALGYLELHAERFPDSAEAAVVAARRVRLLAELRRFEEQERVLRQVAERFGGVLWRGRSLGQWAREQLAALRDRRALPALPGGQEGGEGELVQSFHTRTELGEEEPRLLVPRGLEPQRASVALLQGEQLLAAHDARSGVLLWKWPLAGGLRAERTALVRGVLVLFHGEVLEGLELADGRRRWRLDAAGLGRLLARGMRPAERRQPAGGAAASGRGTSEEQPALDELVPLAVGPETLLGAGVVGERVLLLVRRPGGGEGTLVLALDALSGEERWRLERPELLQGDPLEVRLADGRVLAVLASEAPAGLVAVEPEQGALVYAAELAGGSARLSIRPQAAPDSERLFAVIGGNLLLGIEAASGRVLWRQRLGYWPRELVAAPGGEAVAVLPYGGGRQPALVVFDGASGAVLFEDTSEARPSRVVFGGGDLYVLSGDYFSSQLRAIGWRAGTERWSWSPQRGHSFDTILLARDHLVLPQSGPGGRGVVYALERERGRLFHTFACGGRRVLSAAILGETLVATTSRGMVGFARREPERLRAEVAALGSELAARPSDAAVRSELADRLFKLGETARAVAVLEAGLVGEELELGGRGPLEAYARLHSQLWGYREVEPLAAPIAIGRLARPPAIDGELGDFWRLEQSFELSGPAMVAPVQGYSEVAVLRGRDDLSARLFLGYDDRYFYFALDVDDDRLVPYDSEAEVWKGDCLLIAIDSRGDGGEYFQRDDNLLSLALTLPRRNRNPGEEEREDEPEGKYFVKRKDDGSGATYEVAIPWSMLAERGAQIDPLRGPSPGFAFGFDVVLIDDDDGRGSRKALSWTPAIALHREKHRLWQGFVPGRFARIVCR